MDISRKHFGCDYDNLVLDGLFQDFDDVTIESLLALQVIGLVEYVFQISDLITPNLDSLGQQLLAQLRRHSIIADTAFNDV